MSKLKPSPIYSERALGEPQVAVVIAERGDDAAVAREVRRGDAAGGRGPLDLRRPLEPRGHDLLVAAHDDDALAVGCEPRPLPRRGLEAGELARWCARQIGTHHTTCARGIGRGDEHDRVVGRRRGGLRTGDERALRATRSGHHEQHRLALRGRPLEHDVRAIAGERGRGVGRIGGQRARRAACELGDREATAATFRRIDHLACRRATAWRRAHRGRSPSAADCCCRAASPAWCRCDPR